MPSLGAGADYHYRTEADFLWMGEAARDIDRNDSIVGSIVSRAVTYTLQTGFRPNPDTGDPDLDADLVARWDAESQDARLCDPGGVLTFADQERLVCREVLVAGDIFALPLDTGQVELVEFHRCRSPHRKSKINDRIVHGVEFSEGALRRRLRYWFTRESIDAWKLIDRKDLTPYDAYDEDGEPLVWHVFNPTRPSQTRGVTTFAPIFDSISYHDDIHFATLVKQQLSAFFLILRNRKDPAAFDNNPTPSGPTRLDDSGQRLVEDLTPGSEIRGKPGEDVSAWSPNVPGESWFNHMNLILKIMSVNLGMPLVMALMDASEASYSGYRAAVDQARIGFRECQQRMARQFHSPYWRFRVNRWADQDPALRRQRSELGKGLLKHTWDPPGWAYLEPHKDAAADLLRESNMLVSPRRRCAERGWEWDAIYRETIEDRAAAISMAIAAASKINADFELAGESAVRWRDLAPLPAPERVSIKFAEAAAAVPNQQDSDQ